MAEDTVEWCVPADAGIEMQPDKTPAHSVRGGDFRQRRDMLKAPDQSFHVR